MSNSPASNAPESQTSQKNRVILVSLNEEKFSDQFEINLLSGARTFGPFVPVSPDLTKTVILNRIIKTFRTLNNCQLLAMRTKNYLKSPTLA